MSSQCLEPIAIVGIACEFAGDIHSPTEFWHALKESRDLNSEIPNERVDFMSYCAHMLNRDDGNFSKMLIKRGYFLATRLFDTFEPSFFGLSDGEAAVIDPCHRLLMLKFVHLLDDAGYSLEKMQGSRTAVYIAQFSNDHALASVRLKPEHRSRFHYCNTGIFSASARLSYHFDLRGPNLSLDAACSSSLQAVHLAVQTLRAREADMAVCGGVNSVISPEQLLNFSMSGAVSTDGRSRSFSVDANGYAKGEGLGLVLLKRLSDAERDGDKVYCVLHDVYSNQDGCEDKNSFTVPSAAGQQRAITEIFERTQYDPQRIFYVEAHGTGTQVGDPIEANTLGRFFHRMPLDPPLLIGSVKSNIGHTEGAAGIASLIKVAMCLKHKAIPPNMHFIAVNPKIELQSYNMHVVQTITPFPLLGTKDDKGLPVAMSINSFGVGGNNAHAIVEEYCSKKLVMTKDRMVVQPLSQQPFLFLFSTKSRQSLHEQVALFDRWLQQVPCLDDDFSFLAHVSQQLLLKRTISHEHLAIFVSINRAHLQHQIESFLIQKLLSGVHITERPSQSNCRVCFVFSGQGPQWWGMGRQLYSNEPVYRQWIERIDKQFTVINNSEWCLLQELIEKSEQESRVNDTNIAQPALFAVQVALAGLLVSWHIFPSAIVSHSAGEQAAAFVSGRVTLEEAVRVVYHRSRLQHRNTRQGGSMLSVGMSEREAHEFLLQGIENQVSIAAVNSPRSVTLSGDSTIIDELQQILSTFYPNVFKTQLRIENSFHSHQMDRFNIREEILSSLDDIQGAPLLDAQDMFDSRCSHARLYSSVCGSHLKDETLLNAHYWWSNIRQCVRFSDAIQAIVQDNIIDAFLEISPHPVLSTSMRECCDVTSTNSQLRILPTLKRKEDEHATLLTSLAQLSQSSNVWQHYLASRSIQSTRNEDDLFDTFPLYAFSMTSCWYESKDSAMERLAHRLPVHPLLGVRQWTQQTSATWKSLINLNLTKHAYLQHHKIHGTIMFPAAGFLELALAACRQLLPQPNENEPLLPVAFEQVEFVNALILTEQEHTEVFTQIVMPMQEWLIYSRPWSKGEQDCLRSSGIACSDVLDSFVDPNILNTTSLREFTLHARGRIDVGLHLNTFASLAVRLHDNIANWRVLKPTQVYAHLSTRGYQYGSSFQVTDSFQVTASQAISHVCAKNNEQNDAHYHLHPVTLDGCLHGFMSLLPGVQTFLPFSVNKMIAYGSSFHVPQLIVHATFYPSLAGLSHEHSFAVDLAAYDGREEVITSSTKPVFIFEMFKVRPMSGRWSVSNKSVFERVNELVDLPNADSTEQIDRIMTEHCFQKKWSYMPNEAVTERNLLPSSYTLLDKVNKMEKLNSAGNEIHHQLTHSIEPLNALVANYALQALTHLASLNKTSCIIEHELHSRVRNDEPYYTRLFHACLSFVRHYGLLDEYGNTTSVINAHSIQLIRKQLLGQYPLLKPLLSILHANGSSLGQILSGACDVIALFTENKSNELAMQEVQTLIASLRTDIIFKALTIHIRDARFQRLRVLIVGGGTSSIGLTVLRQLIGFAEETSVRVHILYVDVTTELLLEAEQTFQSVLKDINKKRPQVLVSYQAYNMEDDVNESINLEEAHDIVFAANVLQTTTNVVASIIALRQLLAPGGLLLLVELTLTHPYFDLLYGIFSYWWRDGDANRALLKIDQWIHTINSAGGFESVVASSSPNLFGDTVIIAQKTTARSVLTNLPEWQNQAWILLADRTQNLAGALATHLPSPNIVFIQDTTSKDTIHSTIERMLLQYRQLHIVFAWPLDTRPLGNSNNETIFNWQEEHLCSTVLCILQTVENHCQKECLYPYLYVLTHNAQPIANSCTLDLGAAPLIGLTRSLSVECVRHHVKLLDLQSAKDLLTDQAFISVVAQYLIDSRSFDDFDECVLYQDENDLIKRFQWCYEVTQHNDQNEQLMVIENQIVPQRDADDNPFRLEIAPSRFLADLAWVRELPLLGRLLPDQLHVRVHCVGLNFRDVLKTRGLYPHTREFAQLDKDQPLMDRDESFGVDFTGTVIRSASTRFKIGDRVSGFCLSGVFHSHVIVDTNEVVRVPEDCLASDEQLATLSTGFLTAIFSLKHRVHLSPNKIVLIHAATGATGQACIQYCLAVGARVIATAGSDEKRRFLREHYGIEHVFNSRDLSFVSCISALFPCGVDVIINSLSGPLLNESVKLLASHGQFVELGKRDVFANGHVSMFALRRDCSFHVIDLSLVAFNQPHMISEMLADMMDCIRRGLFKPIEPMTVCEPSEVIDAFTQCGIGKGMGKTIIRMANSEKTLALKACKKDAETSESRQEENMFPPAVCNNGTILISGGCGGLGLAMARWMVEERGVKRLALMTRRTRDQLEQAENNPQLDDWLQLRRVAAEHGANINVVQIDVTRFDEVHEFIELLGQTSYPVRGIIHSALVIEDRVLSNLSMETLTQVMRPKVRGGWNLHNASHLARAPLHFFIMLSSLRNHMINVGSASYNAGNEFLDALAHYRREQLQLPAICISLPAISGAGIFHQRRNVLSSLFSSLGFETLPTGIAFELLEKFFVTQRHCPCPIIFAAKWETIVAHATPLWTHQLSQLIEQKMNPTTVSPLAGSNMDPTSPINSGTILERTRVTAAHLLGASTIVRIDVNRSLVSQGMDSLAAVSLYNWLSREFDVIIPISDILQGISINQIAAQVHSKTAGRSSAVAKKEVISSNKPQGTAVTTRRDIPLYTGMEKVLRYIQGSDSGYIVFFLSSSRITNDTLQSYLLEPYNALTIYVIHTPTFQSTEIACAQETIAQVRRIQPYGPYSIIAVDTESVLVAHEMLAQLQNHTHVGISRILSNDCEQLAQVSFTQSR